MSVYPRVFAGNLNRDSVDDSVLFELFARFVEVRSAKVVHDGIKCFGFVEVTDESEAQQAIELLHGIDFHGRTLHVQHAREKNNGRRD